MTFVDLGGSLEAGGDGASGRVVLREKGTNGPCLHLTREAAERLLELFSNDNVMISYPEEGRPAAAAALPADPAPGRWRSSASFTVEAGVLVRRRALFQLEKAAREHGLQFARSDDGGWFSTEYYVTVSGDEASIGSYLRAVARWVRAQ